MLSFDAIDGGELAAQLKRALAEIGRNIMDPNTDPEATRGMTINFKFKPSGTGTIAIEYEVKPKLVGAKKGKDYVFDRPGCKDRADRDAGVWGKPAAGGS